MAGYSGAMFIKLKFIIFLVIIIPPLLVNSNNVRKRRRPTIDQAEEVESASKLGEIVPDQLALATHPNFNHNNFKPSPNINGGSQLDSQYDYRNSENNVVERSENYRPKQYAKTHYQSGGISFDDTQTAEEYVSKAMQSIGSQGGSSIQTEPNVIPSSTTRNIYQSFDVSEATGNPNPSNSHEKDSVTRSYEVYDYGSDRKLASEPKYHQYQTDEHARNYHQSAQIRASASSEIPKHEIMKQIEKSVIKYMKELAAEGKIPTQAPPQKLYYQVHPLENEKPLVQTVRAKPQHSHHHQGTSTIRTPITKPTKAIYRDHEYHHKTAPIEENVSENYEQNVEFIYEMKSHPTQAPLHKHKISTSSTQAHPHHHLANFDHSSALKNLEDFDMSHVVSEDRPAKKKLYFNSDIYHDINSLPYKSDKYIHDRPPSDHKKSKDSYADYKGYNEYPTTHHQQDPKYIALTEYRQSASSDDKENEYNDEGYPVMNPYQFVLSKKREPNSSKYSESSQSTQSSSWLPYTSEKEPPTNNYEHEQRFISPQKALNSDSYSPKFNHNPDGYGYQHSYKQPHIDAPVFQGHRHQKRRKRGGNGNNSKKTNHTNISSKQDFEANSILRPPPHSI